MFTSRRRRGRPPKDHRRRVEAMVYGLRVGGPWRDLPADFSGTNVVLNATNGFIGGTYYVLTSTNLALPLSQWLPVFTNVLGASGNFNLTPTNALNFRPPRQFYILRVQ